jgi:hypothetical protein
MDNSSVAHTIDAQIKQTLGDLLVQNIAAQARITEMQKTIATLAPKEGPSQEKDDTNIAGTNAVNPSDPNNESRN